MSELYRELELYAIKIKRISNRIKVNNFQGLLLFIPNPPRLQEYK